MRTSRRNKIVFADAFAGCGGLSLGLMQAGTLRERRLDRDLLCRDAFRRIEGGLSPGQTAEFPPLRTPRTVASAWPTDRRRSAGRCPAGASSATWSNPDDLSHPLWIKTSQAITGLTFFEGNHAVGSQPPMRKPAARRAPNSFGFLLPPALPAWVNRLRHSKFPLAKLLKSLVGGDELEPPTSCV